HAHGAVPYHAMRDFSLHRSGEANLFSSYKCLTLRVRIGYRRISPNADTSCARVEDRASMPMPTAPGYHPAAAEADPLLGRVINDRYKIIEQIGSGGMGRVYRALQAPLDRVVALKVLGAGHDRDPNFYKRFFLDRKSTRLNSSHQIISYAVFCLKNKSYS